MINKKIIVLTLLVVGLLAVSSISATEINDIDSINETNGNLFELSVKSNDRSDCLAIYENVTDNNVVDDKLSETISINNGDYNVTPLSINYQENSNNLTYSEPISQNTRLYIEPITTYIGEKINFNVFVCQPKGFDSTYCYASLNDGYVTITINNVDYTSEVYKGKANFDIAPSLMAGSNTCTAKFSGGEYYTRTPVVYGGYLRKDYICLSSTSTFTINTIIKPEIQLSDNLIYGSENKFKVKVIDIYSGSLLKNMLVQIQVKNNENVWKYSGYTNSKGIREFSLNLNNGEYDVNVKVNDVSVTKTIKISKGSAKISTSNINADNKHYTTLKAKITDKNGKSINGGKVEFVIDGDSYKVNVNKGIATKKVMLTDVGIYDCEVIFLNDNFISNPSTSKVIVKKYNVKVSAKKSTAICGDCNVLKAIVKDCNGKSVNEGSVKFKINGNEYKVNVINGIAKKKIKLPKIKTYIYTAKFSSKYFTSKSIKSKAIVLKVPIIKIGKYSIQLSVKDYKKIKRAENKGHFIKNYYTGKKISYKIYKTKTVTLTKKKLLAHSWYSNGNIHSVSYNSANYAPAGYTYVGAKVIQHGSDIKEYQVYKKITKKKVFVGSKKAKVYISIESTKWSGATASLYHLRLVEDGSYYYFLGNAKSIF